MLDCQRWKVVRHLHTLYYKISAFKTLMAEEIEHGSWNFVVGWSSRFHSSSLLDVMELG